MFWLVFINALFEDGKLLKYILPGAYVACTCGRPILYMFNHTSSVLKARDLGGSLFCMVVSKWALWDGFHVLGLVVETEVLSACACTATSTLHVP